MTCVTDEALCALIEGRLGDRDRAMVHGHIEECVSCVELCVALGRSLQPPPSPLSEGQRVGPYQLERRLGQGGMGVVFQARDLRLGRTVALKFIAPGLIHDESALARFRREARAASSIEHPNVCAVLDIVDDPACPHLVLAYAEGGTLKDRLTAGPLPLAEAAPILAQIAAGLAAAHASGVVHRDLKPSNVVVSPAGSVKLIDFGLAKLATAEGDALTRTGDVVGTPAYMAPEQRSGGTIDVRTDVWSFGAVAFEVLTGIQLHDRASGSLALPVGLREIVARCLAADPGDRYADAALLLEDLERARAGRSISGRPSRGLRRVLARHRATLAGTAAAVLLLGTVGWGLTERRAGARRAEVARHAVSAAEEMRSRMRWAYLMPLHDITSERSAVRARLAALEEASRDLDERDRGPVRYALGEGYLALDQPAEARAHLEAAHERGERAPALEASLGLALGQLYGAALADLERLDDHDAREAARLRAEQELLAPAVEHLRASAGADLPRGYTDALIALHSRNYEEAERLARVAFEAAPRFYEAKLVEGEAVTRAGEERYPKDPAAAQELFRRGVETFSPAVEIARSDPEVYRQRAAALFLWADREGGSGGDIQPLIARARDDLDAALQIAPDDVRTWTQAAKARVLLAEIELNHGHDVEALVEEATRLAEHALALAPRDVKALEELGNAWSVLVDVRVQTGKDGSEALSRAADAYRRAIAITPSANRLTNLALTLTGYGAAEARWGVDPTPRFEESVRLAEQAQTLGQPDQREIAPRRVAIAQFYWGEWDAAHGRDPSERWRRADHELVRALGFDPTVSFSHMWRGTIAWREGRRALRNGEDVAPFLARIEQAAAACTERDPTAWFCDEVLVEGRWLAAEAAVFTGRDATIAVAEARAAARKMLKMVGTERETQIVAASIELVAAHDLHARHQSPLPALDAARREIAAAARVDPRDAESWTIAAEVERRSAEWGGRRASIAAGLAAAEKALAIHPSRPEALIARAGLLRRRGEGDDHARAEEDTRNAWAANPSLAHDILLR